MYNRGNSMYNFFFSYSRNINNDIIEQYITSLEEYGFKFWYDKVDVVLGKNINDELYKVLDACEYWNGMILFMDNSYFNKEWCIKELEYALGNNITVYPILIGISKQDIPDKYEVLKKHNLCTIRVKDDIKYAIQKTLFLFLNTINVAEEKQLNLKQHLTLKQLVTDFKNANQQTSHILFICDNIALCLRYILIENNVTIDETIKILYSVIHLITKRYYIDGEASRFQIRIVVKATELLLKICN